MNYNIRKRNKLAELIKTKPLIKYWMASYYTYKGIKQTMQKLKNNKAHGADGIPGEEYRALPPWITRELTHNE